MLLGVTGSIAAYKAALLARLLVDAGADVRVILTASAERFVGADTFAALTGNPVHTSLWERPGEVVHVRLAHEADVAVVAPATANVLAKLANGLADDLLTSTLLEAACPLILAPAMHTGMWQHPATTSNVATLVDRGALFVGPVVGALAAGDEGIGRMAEPEEIFRAIVRSVAWAGAIWTAFGWSSPPARPTSRSTPSGSSGTARRARWASRSRRRRRREAPTSA